MALSCPERIAEGKRTKRSITARTTTFDRESIAIDFPALGKIAGTIHAVINIYDPPLTVEPLTIVPAVAGAAAIVHIEHGNPSAGPELDRIAEGY